MRNATIVHLLLAGILASACDDGGDGPCAEGPAAPSSGAGEQGDGCGASASSTEQAAATTPAAPPAATPNAPAPSAPAAPQPATTPESPEVMLTDLNRFRAMVGLPAATLSAELSAGASAHAAYLAKNLDVIATGLGAHDEDPSRPGFSEAGRAAGQASTINYASPSQSVSGWMATLYHRIPLIRAQQQAVGVGHAKVAESPFDITVLDVVRGLGAPVGDGQAIFPPDGATGVPLEFGPEVPDPVTARPAGYPITLTNERGTITDVAATLTKGATPVPAAVSTPALPATAFDQQGTNCIVAKAPLEPLTTYKVSVQ